MLEYPTPVAVQTFAKEVKRSRFITSVLPVDGRSATRAALDGVRSQWPDANHHCWAAVAGRPDDVFQYNQSDDGEPKGTAGRPMLNVLLHSGFGNTLVVVTRYFGGIKLGAGGLVRAYTQSVSDALANTTTALVTIRERLNVKLQYTDLASFEHRLAQHNATIDAREFTEQVQLVLAFPATARDEIEKLLMTFGAQWSEHTEAEA